MSAIHLGDKWVCVCMCVCADYFSPVHTYTYYMCVSVCSDINMCARVFALSSMFLKREQKEQVRVKVRATVVLGLR